jgi:hypothetical protein
MASSTYFQLKSYFWYTYIVGQVCQTTIVQYSKVVSWPRPQTALQKINYHTKNVANNNVIHVQLYVSITIVHDGSKLQILVIIMGCVHTTDRPKVKCMMAVYGKHSSVCTHTYMFVHVHWRHSIV